MNSVAHTLDWLLNDTAASGVSTGLLRGETTDAASWFCEAYSERITIVSHSILLDLPTVDNCVSRTVPVTVATVLQLVKPNNRVLNRNHSDVIADFGSPRIVDGMDYKGRRILYSRIRDLASRRLIVRMTGFTDELWNESVCRSPKSITYHRCYSAHVNR